MTHIWRLEWYGVGKESARWTSVAPAIWIHHDEADFEDTIEKVIDESSLWKLMVSSASNKTKQYANWEIGGIMPSTSIGFFFLSLLWTVASAETAGTWAYEHDFSMNNVNNKQSLTISKETPIQGLSFALAMVEALTVSANVGEAVKMKAWLRAKAWAVATLTKNYVEDNKFYAHMINIKLADTVAGLDGASALCIENIELSLTQELEDGFCFESGVDLGDIYNKGFAIDGTFGNIRQNITFDNYVKDETYKAMRIEMIDTSKTIWVSDNPTVQIDLARVSFEDHDEESGINDVVRETTTFKGHYDLANNLDINIKVINELSAY